MSKRRIEIGFDARMIAHSGIGSRIQGILNEIFAPASKQGIRITLLGNRKTLEKNLSSKVLNQYGFLPYEAGIYSLREWVGIPEMGNFDLLDIPHFNVPLKYLDRCIVTIHDIIPFRMKKFHSSLLKQFYLRFVFSQIRKKARSILTVSDFTAHDITEVFKIPSARMRTVYNGIDKKVFFPRTSSEIKSFRKKYDLAAEGYLLSVGIGKEHKNLGFILESFRNLWGGRSLKQNWVIAGASGNLPEYLKESAKGWENKIRVLPHLSLEELGILYAGADLMVYPSLYEGFGFPPVEAQACACPVLSSDASVLPEILEQSAFFFNPRNHESFEAKLSELLGSPKLLSSKIKSGIKNAKRFDWKESANRIVSEYIRTIDSK